VAQFGITPTFKSGQRAESSQERLLAQVRRQLRILYQPAQKSKQRPLIAAYQRFE
jgi:hypothetical protein